MGTVDGSMNRRVFIKLSGLTAAAAVVGCAGNTPPPPIPLEPEVRFAIIGDFGETTQLDEFPVDRVGALVRGWNPDFIVSLGDDNYVLGSADTIDDNVGKNFTGYIYPKGVSTFPSRYPYPASAPTVNRFLSILGNHDYADWKNENTANPANVALSVPYIQYFTPSMQSGGVNLYNASNTLADGSTFAETPTIRFWDSVRGPVHLFGFDSNFPTPYGASPSPNVTSPPQPATGIQGQWLQSRLGASTAPWKVVLFHHPPYCSGAGSEFRADLRWPFAAWGATMVLTGHVHNYERLAKADLSGGPTIPYFVNGAGGFIPEEGFNPAVYVDAGSLVRVEDYGAQLVTASADFINFAYYDVNGKLRDSYIQFTDATAGPPQLAFSSLASVVRENAGQLTLTVERFGNADSPLSVAYTTVPGSAQPGVNYTTASGVLVFNSGERKRTINITILNTGPGDAMDLEFSVVLSDPAHPATVPPPSYNTMFGRVLVGMVGETQVTVEDLAETPLTNIGMFVDQTYRDLLVRPPTPGERQAGIDLLTPFPPGMPLQHAKAEFAAGLVSSDAFYGIAPFAPVEAAGKIGQIHLLMYSSSLAQAAGQAVVPTYTDLQFWVGQSSQPPTPDQLANAAAGLGLNAIELLYFEVPSSQADTNSFITLVYSVLLGGITAGSNDLSYWTGRSPNPVSASPPDDSRFRMIAEVATRPSTQMVPAPGSALTAFDMPTANKLKLSVAVLSAGLRRVQIDYGEFVKELNNAQQAGLPDVALKYLNSSDYRNRFM